MHKIKELKEELLDELEGFAGKSKTKDDLVCIKYLASACDHLCNIVMGAEEEEYSRMSRRSYADGMGGSSGRRSYDGGGSYRRGRDSMGRYTSRGRSWSEGPDEETMQKLEDLKETADENTRRVIDRALQELRS